MKKITLFFVLTALLLHCSRVSIYQEKLEAPQNVVFKKLCLPYQPQLIIPFKEIKKQFLSSAKELIEEYTLKSIAIEDKTIAEVIGTKPNFSLKIKKSGTFTIKVTLEHIDFKDISKQTDFEITAENLFVFNKATKTITDIKSQYRYYFNQLSTITIPDKIDGIDVEHIRDSIFKYCSSLIVIIKQTDPTKITLGYKAFYNVKYIKVPTASLATYKKAHVWRNLAFKIVGY